MLTDEGIRSQARVSVTRDVIALPTAGIGFDNPNTHFIQPSGYAPSCAYPYVYHNHYLRERLVDKDYGRITLENDYLIVEFIPELGGRIWRLYDKVHDHEAVHRNDAVKPYPGGFGGAYAAGGIELNYPYAHSVTNVWPRKTEVTENSDGSVTYTVSEWERVGRTLWAMSFTLSPGESRLKQRVTVYNRSKLPLSFCYWGNAGVQINLDSKWIFREAMGSEHGGSTIFTWPEFKGLDLSMFRNDLEIIGIYFLDPKYNFFAATDLAANAGLVHYADRHDLPGKKLWTWGLTLAGENRKGFLSAEPTVYGEIQSGRIINQEHLEWLMPEEYLTWDEQWAPMHGLSDVSEVTEDCAFQLLPEDRKLLAYPFTKVSGQKLRFLADGRPVKEIEFEADTSSLLEIDLSGFSEEQMARLEVKVVKGRKDAGTISTVNRCKRRPFKEIREDPIFDERSSMACFVNAEFAQKLLYRHKAFRYYEKAIELDHLNYKAYTGLGRMLFAHGRLDEAREKLVRATDCYKWDTEAHLMLSHTNHLQGRIDEAIENAFDARYYGDRCRANIKLGELYILKQDFESALSFLEEAIRNNAMSLRSYALAALCQRKLGGNEEATVVLRNFPESALKDLMRYSEMWFLGRITESDLKRELFNDEWRFLELGLDYAELGLYDEAEKLLDLGISLHRDGWELENIYNPDRIWEITRKRENPFLHMVKGYIAANTGRVEAAREHFQRGDYFEYSVNANQVEMEDVLKTALRYGSVTANHYLGNYLYHNLRTDEAAQYWEAAEAGHIDCSVNTRNLAVHARYVKKDLERARQLLRDALRKNPNDLFPRLELIEAEKACAASAEDVLELYLSAPEEQRNTYLFRGLLAAYMSAEKWEEAAEYLRTVDRCHTDTSDEAGWYDFCVSYADFLIDHNRPDEALAWLLKSRPNPENLTYVNYPEEFMYRHQELYLTGLAYKMLGQSENAKNYFQETAQRPADFYFFQPWEDMTYRFRFYVALALKELGMEPAARSLLGGINKYRETRALVPLGLDKTDLNRWGEEDPDSLVTIATHAGPEI